MRTASIDQSTPSSTPKVSIVVSGDTHTSEGGGGNNKLSRVATDEMPWGGQYTIDLDNSDEALNAKDYGGKPLTLNETFVGETADNFSPLWVHSQRFTSREGKLLLQLNCVDIWTLIAAHNTTLANASYNQQWQTEAELSIRYLPDETTLLSVGAASLYADLLANGNKTIWGIIQDLASACGVTVSMDDDDGYVNALKPPTSVSNARSGMRQIMDMTECYLKWKTNGTLGVYQPSAHGTAYSFNTSDLTFSNIEEEGVTIPNRITFWAYHPDGDAWVSGTAQDTASYNKLGEWVDRHYLVATIDTKNRRSAADLVDLAEGALEKIKAERNQGLFVAPMHISLELLDKVEVVDSRYDTPKTITGYVHRMVREYDRGKYQIVVYLGGVAGGYTPPGGADAKSLADSEPPTAPAGISGLDFLPAYLPVVIDIVFEAVDWQTVKWYSGTIKAASGEQWSIDAGQKVMDNDNVYYLYYDVVADTGTLANTQTFTNTVTTERILVGFLKRGASSADEPLIIIGSQGKDLFIDKLSAITADLGLITAGEIRVGTGTLGVDFTGFRHWVEGNIGRIAGYVSTSTDPQWYTGSDGKLYAGGGKVKLHELGISIDGLFLELNDSDGNHRGYIYGTLGGGIAIFLVDAANNHLDMYGNIEPHTSNAYKLGETNRQWYGGYFHSRLKIPVGADLYD